MPAVPAPPSRNGRAARRRLATSRSEAAPSVVAAVTRRRVLLALWIVVVGALLVATAIAVERKITWYLAVDQFGYLTFAHDLLHGRVFHHWPPIDALAPRLPRRVDILSQTYVFDNGRAYCRYAPGFAMLLAAWIAALGDDAAAYLNPAALLALLAVALAFQARVFRSRWRAAAGVALIVLLPTTIDAWSLTLVRDLPTHLCALVGLFVLLPRGRPLAPARTAVGGLTLGLAGSFRPDALLYAPPALLLALLQWRRARARNVTGCLGAGAGGLAIGLAPFLIYNAIATGNPLRPTQGMEVERFLQLTPPTTLAPGVGVPQGLGFPPVAWGAGPWQGGGILPVQGGALQLVNLPTTLPKVIAVLRASYGDVLIGLAVWGAVLALVRRRTLFVTAVPYTILAILFFSCWAKPDPRYLIGVFVFAAMLIVEGVLGTLDVVRIARRTGHATAARVLAVAFAVALGASALLVRPDKVSALLHPYVFNRGTLVSTLDLVAGIGAAAAAAAAVATGRRVAGVAAPVLALALVGNVCAFSIDAAGSRARFQRPEMLRARATFARAVPPGGVVITSEDVGRPAENIGYYSGVANALYITDLMRWRLPIHDAIELLLQRGFTPYILISATAHGRANLVAGLGERFVVEVVADIPAERAIDYFVAAAFYPRGVHMILYRLRPGAPVPAP